ncbi:hypothetical protein Hte_004791 [Hypoxylon texense]
MSLSNGDGFTSHTSLTSTIERRFILLRQPPPEDPRNAIFVPHDREMVLRKSGLKALTESIQTETPRWEDFAKESDNPVTFTSDNYENAIRYSVHVAEALRTAKIPALIFFCDGSWKPKTQGCGIGITYKRTYGANNNWIDASYGLYGVQGIRETEIMALHRSLWSAYYETMYQIGRRPGGDQKTPRVVIMTDCISAIHCFFLCYHGRETMVLAQKLLTPLQKLIGLGSHVEFRWCPSHLAIEGNERADDLADLGADYSVKAPPGSLGSGVVLLPLMTLSTAREPVKICSVHSGRPFTDIMLWRGESTRLTVGRFLMFMRKPMTIQGEMDLMASINPIRWPTPPKKPQQKRKYYDRYVPNYAGTDEPPPKRVKTGRVTSARDEADTMPITK